jgi:hypothetical protein
VVVLRLTLFVVKSLCAEKKGDSEKSKSGKEKNTCDEKETCKENCKKDCKESCEKSGKKEISNCGVVENPHCLKVKSSI